MAQIFFGPRIPFSRLSVDKLPLSRLPMCGRLISAITALSSQTVSAQTRVPARRLSAEKLPSGGADWDATGDNRGMVPPGATNVSEVSGGYYHNLAVKRNLTILSWGVSAYAQTNVAVNYSNTLAVAANEI